MRFWDLLGFTGNIPRILTRKIAMTFIGLGHVGLGVLALTHHLTYANPSRYELLASADADHLWIVIQFGVAAFIVVSLLKNRWFITAMSMSAGFMGAFGFLNGLSGLTATGGVSLVGPVLALALSGTAYAVAMSWAVAPRQQDRSGDQK